MEDLENLHKRDDRMIKLFLVGGFSIMLLLLLFSLVNASEIAYYDFEGDADDFYGNHNGTILGSTLTTGKFGQGYLFDGINDYINLSTSKTMTDVKSVSLWIKGTIPDSIYGRNLIGKTTPGDYLNTILLHYNNGIMFYNDSTHNMFIGLTWNSWTHIVFTIKENSNSFYYIEKTNIVNKTLSPSPFSNNYEWLIGGGGTNRYFNGTIDEIRIFNTSLTTTEIYNLYSYNSINNMSCSGQFAYYGNWSLYEQNYYGENLTRAIYQYEYCYKTNISGYEYRFKYYMNESLTELELIEDYQNDIYEVLKMLPLILLYGILTWLTIYMLNNNNFILGLGMNFAVFGFDLYFVQWIYENYISGNIANTWQGTFIWIFGVMLFVFAITKMIGIFYIKTRRKNMLEV